MFQDLYERAPEWGWKDEEKMKEFNEKKQHILIVHNESGVKIGIVSFRRDL